MKITDLHKAISNRDNCSLEDADKLIKEMASRVHFDGENPEEVLNEEGFEPDYVFNLLYHN